MDKQKQVLTEHYRTWEHQLPNHFVNVVSKCMYFNQLRVDKHPRSANCIFPIRSTCNMVFPNSPFSLPLTKFEQRITVLKILDKQNSKKILNPQDTNVYR